MICTRAAEIASEIRLTRAHHGGSFLVVEGRDDRLFMEAFTSADICRIFVARGKQDVYDVIDVLDGIEFHGALGIVDSDFDRLYGVQHLRGNIVSYDYHDLETMLMFSSALDRVVVEFGSRSKISRRGGNVLRLLIERALAVGYLRIYSNMNDLGLRFDGVRFSSWIDRSSLDWSFGSLMRAVANNSAGQSLQSDQIDEVASSFEARKYDAKEVCVGSDLVAVLALGLRTALGTNNAGVVSECILRKSLRLAYSIHMLLNSRFGRDIRAWERNCSPFSSSNGVTVVGVFSVPMGGD